MSHVIAGRVDPELRSRPKFRGGPAQLLFDEVADVSEDTLTEFHTPQACAEWDAELLFKTLEDVARQIRPLPKQSQQCRTIRCVLVASGLPARWADCQHKWERSCVGPGAIRRSSAEIYSHTGILTPVCATLNGTDG